MATSSTTMQKQLTDTDCRRRKSTELNQVDYDRLQNYATSAQPSPPQTDSEWAPDLEGKRSEATSPWAGRVCTTLSGQSVQKQSSVDLRRLPQELRDVVGKHTKSGSGSVGTEELVMALMDMSVKKEDAEQKMFKRMLLFSVVLILILAASVSALSFVSAEFAKELTVSSSGSVLTTVGGSEVHVFNAEFQVAPGGELVSRNSTGDESGQGGGVATQQTRTRQALHSALPDSFFEALDELTVYSTKGQHLTLTVHGFARIPVLNSRCGNIVHLFTAWGARVTLDSDALSFDRELGSMFENAGFELAVGGVGGRRLTNVWGVSGLFHHVHAMADDGSWTCKDVPLPVVAPHHLAKATIYRPCSRRTGVLPSDCDSKYGGSFAGVAELPTEHRDAAMNPVQRIQRPLGIADGQDGPKYYSYNLTVVSSSSYRAQVTHHPGHPLQDHFSIINTAEATGVDFQWLKIPGIGERFYCKAVENVTGQPAYMSAVDHEAGVHPDSHFEFVGLDSFGDVVYRHFRYVFDFPSWANASAVAPEEDRVVHLWDNAETLELYRVLLPGGTMQVFQSYITNVSDSTAAETLQELLRGSPDRSSPIVDPTAAEENEFEGAPWSGLATAACHDFEADGVSDVTGLSSGPAPTIGSSFQDLSVEEVSFYAAMLADEGLGDDGDVLGGWRTLRQVPEGSTLYGFAQYAQRVHGGALATGDACSKACEATVNGVLSFVQVGGGALCSSPGLGQMLRCIAALPTALSRFCESTPLVKGAAGCVQAQAQQQAGRRLQKVDGDVMPDGTHRVDLSAVSWRVRADLSKELGIDLLSHQTFLYSNSSGARADGVLAETVSSTGVSHSRRLPVLECHEDDNVPATPGVKCYRFIYPSSCAKVDGVRTQNCTLQAEVALQLVGGKSALTLRFHGEGDLIGAFFGGDTSLPVWGRIGGDGADITFASNSSSCADIIPFDLVGQVNLFITLGANLPIFGPTDLATLDLRLYPRNVVVEAYTARTRTDRRRRWNVFSRRRRAEWTTKEIPKQCDIEVVGETCLQAAILKGCLDGSYKVNTKRFVLAVRTYAYNPLPFMSSWHEIWSGNVIDKQA